MDRLTKRFEDGEYYSDEFGAVHKSIITYENGEEESVYEGKLVDKLAEYEDREEFLEKQVYFILNDKLAENKVKGDYYVSEPHSVIDVSIMGFWTGSPEDFPFNADFTRWDEEYFISYQAAKDAIERMVIE